MPLFTDRIDNRLTCLRRRRKTLSRRAACLTLPRCEKNHIPAGRLGLVHGIVNQTRGQIDILNEFAEDQPSDAGRAMEEMSSQNRKADRLRTESCPPLPAPPPRLFPGIQSAFQAAPQTRPLRSEPRCLPGVWSPTDELRPHARSDRRRRGQKCRSVA